MNLSMFAAAILAWLWLSERVRIYDILAVVFVVACVKTAILGAEGEQKTSIHANIGAMILLAF